MKCMLLNYAIKVGSNTKSEENVNTNGIINNEIKESGNPTEIINSEMENSFSHSLDDGIVSSCE